MSVDDSSKFKGRKQNCGMSVDDYRHLIVKSHSVELRTDSLSVLVLIEREPDFFSIHDKNHMKKCLAIDPEWKGQTDTEAADQVKNLIICEKYEGK